MSSLQEIETAIGSLSIEDRAKLIHDLPALLPEWEADLAWARILNDPTPSPALSALADSLDREHERNPERFPEIKDSDFDRHA
ncbi:MAG: hypothetical protein JWO95_1607 [Verrucomicrobiales bacterium]|nr:hypothetical protein [Verrucomicrobiales bacterium]